MEDDNKKKISANKRMVTAKRPMVKGRPFVKLKLSRYGMSNIPVAIA